MPAALAAVYADKLARGEIAADAGQAAALKALERLEGELRAAEGPRLPFLKRRAAPRGVYLWGGVGRGKSMLMDLFFDAAPVAAKRRVHFHAFMGEVHGLIDVWRNGEPDARRTRFHGVKDSVDPITATATVLAAEARLLCFDEFHVTDIADAMILGRLFQALFAEGVVVVATSNRAPGDLYADGINRQLFLPFIALFEQKLEVVEIGAGEDHRLGGAEAERRYLCPLTPPNEAAFDRLWQAALGGLPETTASLTVQGRTLSLPHAADEKLRAGFASLCGLALGAQDYLAIAAQFGTVFLADVPVLGAERRNEAARFVTLIDALYEARTRLVVLAAAEPDELYPAGDGSFEFERTASRLHEMRAADWPDGPPPASRR